MKWPRRAWSWLRWLLAAAAGAVVYGLSRKALSKEAWAHHRNRWRRIPGRQDAVRVKRSDGKWQTVKLPDDVKADDVENVGYSSAEGGTYRVEKKHDPTDRRDARSIDGNALDELGD